MSSRGLIWQARRTRSGAAIRRSSLASLPLGGGSLSPPSSTSTRQVAQRARPPQSAAWGMPKRRNSSSTVGPGVSLRTPWPTKRTAMVREVRTRISRKATKPMKKATMPKKDGLGPEDVLVEHRDLGAGIGLGRQGQPRRLAPGDGEADQRQDRDQDRREQERVAPAQIGLAGAQREMQADDAMDPDQQQQDRLRRWPGRARAGAPPPDSSHPGQRSSPSPACRRCGRRGRAGSARRAPICSISRTGMRKVRRWATRTRAKSGCTTQRAVKRDRADPGLPEPVPPVLDRLHRRDAGYADGVVEEMGGGEEAAAPCPRRNGCPGSRTRPGPCPSRRGRCGRPRPVATGSCGNRRHQCTFSVSSTWLASR